MKKIRNYLLTRSRKQKTLILIFSDILIFNFSFVLSFLILLFIHKNNLISFSLNWPVMSAYFNIPTIYILVINLFSISIIYLLKGYKTFFRSSPAISFVGTARIFSAFVFSFLIFLVFYLKKDYPFILSFRFGLYFFIVIIFYYVLLRTFAFKFLSGNINKKQIPILIYGAGQAGRETAALLSQNDKYKIVGFLDDNLKLKDFYILGFKVSDNLKKIKKLKKNHPNLLVILSIVNISSLNRKKIISNLENYNVNVKSIPANYRALKNKLKIENLSLNDLLDRDEISQEENLPNRNIENKNILITGAGGSIGSELSLQISNLNPKSLILLDSSEFNLYKLEMRFENLKNYKKMKFFLRDVQNSSEMNEIIKTHKIDSIFHAAAYKHVPLLQKEENFFMALKNNFFATFNLCEVAYKNNVSSFTLISSDKAVNPTNIMGASKRLSELSLQAFQVKNKNNTCFSMVRFGNVLNSSGSVVPLFWEQINSGGPVTVTHKDINRFFMTIEEASSLVIKSNSIAQGGEVFLLDMGSPIKIKELAEKMIRLSGNSIATDGKDGIEILYSGLRPGEKLFEELLLSNNPINTQYKKIKKGLEKKHNFNEIETLKKNLEINSLSNNIENIDNLICNFVEGYKI